VRSGLALWSLLDSSERVVGGVLRLQLAPQSEHGYRENSLASFGLTYLLGYVRGRHVGLQKGFIAGEAQVKLR
jgi:hypothetical protein